MRSRVPLNTLSNVLSFDPVRYLLVGITACVSCEKFWAVTSPSTGG